MIQKTVVLKLGLDGENHPIAMIVQVASKFSSNIHIQSGNKKVNAKSIMGMMSISLLNDEEIDVIAEGSDESLAVDEMIKHLTK